MNRSEDYVQTCEERKKIAMYILCSVLTVSTVRCNYNMIAELRDVTTILLEFAEFSLG